MLVDIVQVGVFERILVALKDRIPLKLQQEDLGKVNSGSKQKREKVDVFRGSKLPSPSRSLSL